ncbi:MAG: hypothetical protein SPI30_05580 [Prevotella sp.]|nr:hypothetical protein [Prevotella sp.]
MIIYIAQETLPNNKPTYRIIVPMVGTRTTKHWYAPYQSLVRRVPTTGSLSAFHQPEADLG